MKKLILLSLGWLSFILGMIGVVFPILPTTPFILLAAFLFTKSSKHWEKWLKERRVYHKYVVAYKQNKGLTLRQKVEIFTTVSLLLLVGGLLVSHPHMRFVLAVIAICKFVVLWKVIPTVGIKQGEITE